MRRLRLKLIIPIITILITLTGVGAYFYAPPVAAQAAEAFRPLLPLEVNYGSLKLGKAIALIFEGATVDANQTTLTVTDPTAARTITLPDASITVPGTFTATCGTAAAGSAAACSSTTISSTARVVIGTAALLSASPSAVTITAMPAFSGTNTYTCSADAVGNTAAIAAGGIAITNVSATSVTFTGPNTVTTPFSYICIGT